MPLIKAKLVSLFTILLVSNIATAKPFYHKFGELREYHRDWLAVCPDKHIPGSASEYERNCWASTFSGNPDGTLNGDFPGNRLTVSRNRQTGKMAITFVAQSVDQLDTTRPIKLTFSSGKSRTFVYGSDVTPNGNSANEYTFTNPDHVRDIIRRMRKASYVKLDLPLMQGTSISQFSAMGLSGAIAFTRKYAGHKR